MPYLKITTNHSLPAEARSVLLARASTTLAQHLNKPERYVMVEASGGAALRFGGNDAPAAYVELKSIGLDSAQTKPLSKAISELLHEELGLAPERIYIEFTNITGNWWGWNGSTF